MHIKLKHFCEYSSLWKISMNSTNTTEMIIQWNSMLIKKTPLNCGRFKSCVELCRNFVERCHLCDTLGSEDVSQRAQSSLERIVNQSVRVLSDILFEHIRVRHMHRFTSSLNMFLNAFIDDFLARFQPFFDKLVKRKWLDNNEAYESIEMTIKQHFKKFRRMDCPPYQVWHKCIPAHTRVHRLIGWLVDWLIDWLSDRHWWMRCIGGSWLNMFVPSWGGGSSVRHSKWGREWLSVCKMRPNSWRLFLKIWSVPLAFILCLTLSKKLMMRRTFFSEYIVQKHIYSINIKKYCVNFCVENIYFLLLYISFIPTLEYC